MEIQNYVSISFLVQYTTEKRLTLNSTAVCTAESLFKIGYKNPSQILHKLGIKILHTTHGGWAEGL